MAFRVTSNREATERGGFDTFRAACLYAYRCADDGPGVWCVRDERSEVGGAVLAKIVATFDLKDIRIADGWLQLYASGNAGEATVPA